MLGHAAPTPYDLRFQLFGIPVRVTPWFWLLAALLGWAPGRLDLVAVWIGCVFLSSMVHEFGHALTARAFGWPPQIVLYHFGGYASYTPTSRNTPTRGAIVSFAGPAAGFVLCFLAFACGLVMIANRLTAPPLITAALFDLVWINLVWGIPDGIRNLRALGSTEGVAARVTVTPKLGTNLAEHTPTRLGSSTTPRVPGSRGPDLLW